MLLANTPPKGTSDRYPEEFNIRSYIFNTRKKVCESFAYEEYLAPLVENADIYRAKSGEDVGGSELTLLTDRDGNISDIALRPEMTPSVTRMITRNYTQTPKPIRYFSIANFYRNERPQRGRNREFWQLNVDLFGSKKLNTDTEILQMAMEIILAFNPPKDSRELHLNHRKLIETMLNDIININENQKVEIVRIMDKRNKLTLEKFNSILEEKGLNTDQIKKLTQYMQIKTIKELKDIFPSLVENKGFQEIEKIINKLQELGYSEYITFNSSLIRGFDYYDGMVFEVFDKHPKNNRAMYGGGRYNGLATIFGSEDIPAVGFAPGDEAMKIFLESRGMLDNIKNFSSKQKYYVPILEDNIDSKYQLLAKKLRAEGNNVVCGIETQKFSKAIQSTNKNGFSHMIIMGSNEISEGIYKIKNMGTGEENNFQLD